MSTTTAIQLADLNLAGSLRHFAEHAAGGAVEERGGMLLFSGGHAYPGAYCNGVLRLDGSSSARANLAAARGFFAERRRGYAVWVRDHADAELAQEAERLGYLPRPPAEGMPGMLLGALVLDPPTIPAGARIEPIGDLAMASEYLLVVADAYGMRGTPPELTAGIFFEPGSVLADNVSAVLATLEGRPAAGAMSILTDGVCGLYWVATAAWARGRGLGTACAALATNAGFELGAHTATLQASQMGTRMWQSLGFIEVTRYRRFLAPPPARPHS